MNLDGRTCHLCGIVVDNLNPEDPIIKKDNMTDVKLMRDTIDHESYLRGALDLCNEGLRNITLGLANWSAESKLSESLDLLKQVLW